MGLVSLTHGHYYYSFKRCSLGFSEMLVSAAYLIMRFCVLQDLLAFVNQSVKDCENRQVRTFNTFLLSSLLTLLTLTLGYLWLVLQRSKRQPAFSVECS